MSTRCPSCSGNLLDHCTNPLWRACTDKTCRTVVDTKGRTSRPVSS